MLLPARPSTPPTEGGPRRGSSMYNILGAVADANIEVDMIIQNISKDGKTDFSFTVHRNDYARTVHLLKNKVLPSLGTDHLEGDTRICKISIVGIGMRSHVGVAAKMFRSRSEEGINIQMLSAISSTFQSGGGQLWLAR